VTFANAQKISSDLDELTGDPKFRSNIRNLVNGLSGLVSSGSMLEFAAAGKAPTINDAEKVVNPELLRDKKIATETSKAEK